MPASNFPNRIKEVANGFGPVALVVDDTPEQLDMLVDVVRGVLTGWEVRTATSENEAYEQIEGLGEHIQVAVVDLRLIPGKDEDNGIRVLEKLRRRVPGCFNIIVSRRASSRREMTKLLEGAPAGLANRVVSLRYIDSDPITELQRALRASLG